MSITKYIIPENIEEIERECVKELRKLLEDDPEIPNALKSLEDDILYLFIRARRNRPPVSFKLIKSLIHYRTKQYPDLFEDLKASSIQPVMDHDMIRVVKQPKDGQGPAVMVFKTSQWNTSLANMDMLIKGGFLYALNSSAANTTPERQRNGIIMVMDMGGFSFSHARECSYSNVTKLANCIIFGSPFRIVCANLVNSPYIFEKVWGVVKFAIPEYYRNFIVVTRNDFTKLHELVGPSGLPESLGGTVPEGEGWDDDLKETVKTDGGQEIIQNLLDVINESESSGGGTNSKN